MEKCNFCQKQVEVQDSTKLYNKETKEQVVTCYTCAFKKVQKECETWGVVPK